MIEYIKPILLLALYFITIPLMSLLITLFIAIKDGKLFSKKTRQLPSNEKQNKIREILQPIVSFIVPQSFLFAFLIVISYGLSLIMNSPNGFLYSVAFSYLSTFIIGVVKYKSVPVN